MRLVDLQMAPPDKLASLAMTIGTTATRRSARHNGKHERRPEFMSHCRWQNLTSVTRIQKLPNLTETAHAFTSELKNTHPATCQDLHPLSAHSTQIQCKMDQLPNENTGWADHSLITINLVNLCLKSSNHFLTKRAWNLEALLSCAMIIPS